MKKKAMTGILLLSLILSIISCSFSESNAITYTKADWYQEGLQYMKLKMYEEAIEAFEKAGDYEQSSTIVMSLYCQGMILLVKADNLEKENTKDKLISCLNEAEDLFAGIDYEDSKKVALYIQARKYQAQGLTQKAIDMYYDLFGTCDSHSRYRLLVFPDNIISLISAKANKDIPTYAGPGSAIFKSEPFIISKDTDVSIAGQNGEWYLVEVNIDDALIRTWVPKVRIQRNEPTEPHKLDKNISNHIKDTVEVYYGPGSEYLKMDIILQSNTSVTVMGEDGEYSLIQFTSNEDQKQICGWVITTCLSKQ